MEEATDILYWDDSLALGVAEIDDDHRKLIGLLNELAINITAHQAREALAVVLENLLNYTAWHFRHEERLMQTYRFSGYVAHKREHADLIREASAFQKKFLDGEQDMTMDVVHLLKEWVLHHVMQTDRQMAEFLAEHM
ncbi:bacteriohemerythrin [Candidatus Magnetaquicoccus inordinatus]|uniref:bacteriohemerythrin n=1 Tax=Candidatus Magnetaquicoccus inordinatus TaxID=2496818 RepID=UPI00102B69AD|nr:bacteriohemerythrin [Candidatus Magnetaquicoccus inordinatus]